MSEIFLIVSLALFGLVFGSFITALSYRSIRGVSIFKGRSLCPLCKKKISWSDNIPIISYLSLNGKSRCCGKPISWRYPLIEFFTMLTFLLIGLVYTNCSTVTPPLCVLNNTFSFLVLPYLLLISLFLITVFITDFEHKIILDEFIFIPYGLTLLLLIFFNPEFSYTNIFLSFTCAAFLLLVHLITRGKGMGLGDVKLALLPPLILGWPFTLPWLFLSFIIGALVGVILMLMKKAKFGKQIPFGPFLILAFFLVLFWGDKLMFLFGFLTLSP
ncbi:MAG: Type 4 prepilin-like protein leader peptide-processing enzyme [Candidatus Woesebacteria bacterium GW2011_GWA1_39_21]|uniref:Type 4 prepilin-like protein leader peptide-processing enzyme n=1 Tax=Candidatus Woesebacteria bacterium GW2011_GWA1_39_21 TaxID=1618550 RepID=A0A0G0NGQ2_9BACT|nr:MAG: Type 4 prepilin-like protein leader peptide-processing enzyme [Candidatus Woesebacteria bacterium GW2011_GWA1_39_21]